MAPPPPQPPGAGAVGAIRGRRVRAVAGLLATVLILGAWHVAPALVVAVEPPAATVDLPHAPAAPAAPLIVLPPAPAVRVDATAPVSNSTVQPERPSSRPAEEVSAVPGTHTDAVLVRPYVDPAAASRRTDGAPPNDAGAPNLSAAAPPAPTPTNATVRGPRPCLTQRWRTVPRDADATIVWDPHGVSPPAPASVGAGRVLLRKRTSNRHRPPPSPSVAAAADGGAEGSGNVTSTSSASLVDTVRFIDANEAPVDGTTNEPTAAAAVAIEGTRRLVQPAMCLDGALCERIGRKAFAPMSKSTPASTFASSRRPLWQHKVAVHAARSERLHEPRRLPDWAVEELRGFARDYFADRPQSVRRGGGGGGRTYPVYPVYAHIRAAAFNERLVVNESTGFVSFERTRATSTMANTHEQEEGPFADLVTSMMGANTPSAMVTMREELARDFNLDLAMIPDVPVYPNATALVESTAPRRQQQEAPASNASSSGWVLPIDFVVAPAVSDVMGWTGTPRWTAAVEFRDAAVATPSSSSTPAPSTTTGGCTNARPSRRVAAAVSPSPAEHQGAPPDADMNADVVAWSHYAQLVIHRSQQLPVATLKPKKKNNGPSRRRATCATARIQYTPLSDIGLGGAIRLAANILGHAMLAGRLLVFEPGWGRWGGRKGTTCAGLGWECFFLPPSACSSAEVAAVVKKAKAVPKPTVNAAVATSIVAPSRAPVTRRTAVAGDPTFEVLHRGAHFFASRARIVKTVRMPKYAGLKLTDLPDLMPENVTRLDVERTTGLAYNDWAMQQLTRYLLRGLQPWAEGLVLQELGRAGYPWAGAGPVVAAHFRNGEGLWHYEVHPQLGCAALDASFQVALLEEAVWALDRAAAAAEEEEGASETKTPPPGRRECRAVPFLSFDAAWAVNATARWFAETTDEDTPQGTAAGDGAHQLCDAGRRAALRAVVVEPPPAPTHHHHDPQRRVDPAVVVPSSSNVDPTAAPERGSGSTTTTAAPTFAGGDVVSGSADAASESSSAVAAIGSDTRDAITARHGKGHLMRVSLGNLFLAAGADAWVNNDASNWGLLINSLRGTAARRWRGAYVDVREAARALGAETVARFCNVVGDVEWDASGWERARRALRAHLQRESQHPSAPP